MKSLPLAALMVLGAAIFVTGSVANAETPDELIAKLRAIPLREEAVGIHGGEFFDMHGNAIPELQELMERRFEVTLAICRELERPKLAKRYAAALYDVLAL